MSGKRWSKGGKMTNLPSIVAPEAKISWINELLVLRHVTAIIIKNVQRQQRQFNYLQTRIGGKVHGGAVKTICIASKLRIWTFDSRIYLRLPASSGQHGRRQAFKNKTKHQPQFAVFSPTTASSACVCLTSASSRADKSKSLQVVPSLLIKHGSQSVTFNN